VAKIKEYNVEKLPHSGGKAAVKEVEIVNLCNKKHRLQKDANGGTIPKFGYRLIH